MNRQRVSEIEFWKDRIVEAKAPHHSVYVANEALWAYILSVHLKIIKKLFTEDDKVLDAACGYGRMAQYFKPKNYVGVDFSPDFIEWAQKDNEGYDFVQADIKALPFKDKEFDWAFCISLKHMIRSYASHEDWDKMEAELRRVAKKVLILEYSDPQDYEIL